MDYTTIEDVDTVAEELGAIVSSDYSPRRLTPPGKYLNESRAIKDLTNYEVTLSEEVAAAGKIANRKVKVYMFQVDLSSIVNPSTGESFSRPDRAWIDTRPKRKPVVGKRGEFYPGTTNGVVDYLLACGYGMKDLRNLNGVEAVRSILTESVARRVGVAVELTARGKKTGVTKANGKEFYRTPGNPSPGIYQGKRLYTKAFAGPDGTWLTEATDENGEVWQAGEAVQYWFKAGA